MKKTIIMLSAALALTLPAQGFAQFGGLNPLNAAKSKLGLGGSSSSSAASDPDGFLQSATLSTKNVMISAALLAQAVTDRTQLVSRKAQIDALQNAQSIGELNAHTADFKKDMAVLNERKDLAADVSAAYQQSDKKQQGLISTAVGNLAIGLARDVKLADQAPGMVSSASGNPQMISRVGQLKTAASLLGLQVKGLGGVAKSLPALMTAAKVRGPDAAETSEPRAVAL